MLYVITAIFLGGIPLQGVVHYLGTTVPSLLK